MSAGCSPHQRRQSHPGNHAARRCRPCVFQAIRAERSMIVSVPWRRVRHRVARVLAVARIECLHLLRDRTTIALVFTVPAIQIVLFGYAVNLNPKAIPVAITRNQGNPIDQLRRTVEETGYFSILADRLEPGAAERMLVE